MMFDKVSLSYSRKKHTHMHTHAHTITQPSINNKSNAQAANLNKAT